MPTQDIDPNSYLAQWLGLRRWEATAWLTFLLYPPGAAGLNWLMTKLTGSDIPGMIVAFAWMIIAAVFNGRLVRFRCPRCQERFFCVNGPGFLSLEKGWLFAQECVHCGLPKYALTETGEPKLTDFEYDP